MASFLITFKPAAENPERGWPLEKLQRLVKRHNAGEPVIEWWRFHNRKAVSLRDRVFLLLQGTRGPAIIGYGRVAELPENRAGQWQAAIEFEEIVDPSTHFLASKDDLRGLDDNRQTWGSQSSGVLLADKIATDLEALVVGKPPKSAGENAAANPDWTRDELILALNVYLQHRPNPLGKGSEEIRQLSESLRRLGEKLFPPQDRASTFRNENGVYMKLMNFRRLDPQYTDAGKIGLTRGAKAEEEVWAEFSRDPAYCRRIAEAIIASLDDFEASAAWIEPDVDDGIQEAAEGRLLTRKHIARERNRKLVESKRKQALKRNGKLICEVCDFDFAQRYGDRGSGFMECHHVKPVAFLVEGHKTHLDDLALVCANCHRMIHRTKPWLSITEVKKLMR